MLSPAIISIIVALVIVGLVLYLIDIIPMDGTIKQIIRVIVIIVAAAIVRVHRIGAQPLPPH